MVSCWQRSEVGNEPGGDVPFDVEQTRRRIAEITDELTVVQRTDIGRWAALGAERDALSAQLRAVSAGPDVARRWAERATPRPASAPSHIPSHSEGGGSSPERRRAPSSARITPMRGACVALAIARAGARCSPLTSMRTDIARLMRIPEAWAEFGGSIVGQGPGNRCGHA